jgi:hypothetical protein
MENELTEKLMNSKRIIDIVSKGDSVKKFPISSQGGPFFYVDKSEPNPVLKKYEVPVGLVEKFRQTFGDENGNVGLYLTEEEINNFVKTNEIPKRIVECVQYTLNRLGNDFTITPKLINPKDLSVTWDILGDNDLKYKISINIQK